MNITFKSIFETQQDKLFFALDGLDESKSKRIARKEFNPNETEFPNSLIMILSRPEAKKYIETSIAEVTEFEITRLSKEQYQNFALNYPFQVKFRGCGESWKKDMPLH